jgi:hypothetical protein
MDEELLVLALREQRDRRAEYFAAMAYTIAKQAKLNPVSSRPRAAFALRSPRHVPKPSGAPLPLGP